MVMFGLWIIAILGYGVSVIASISAIVSLKDAVVATHSSSKTSEDGITAEGNIVLCLKSLAAAVVSALATSAVLAAFLGV